VISTFKQTWQSLKDPGYGQVIQSRSVKSALWYWTKWFLFLSAIPTVILLCVITYFTPQLPHLIQSNIPEGFVGISHGQLDTSFKDAWQYKNPDFNYTYDPKSDPEKVSDFAVGLTVLKDRMVLADPDHNLNTQKFSDLPDFQVSKAGVLGFVSPNLVKIWLSLLGIVLVLYLVVGLAFWAYKLVSFATVGLLFFILAKILKQPVTYWNAFKLSVFASVLSFIFSFIFGLMPSLTTELISLAILFFYGYRWLKPTASVTPQSPSSDSPTSTPDSPRKLIAKAKPSSRK
jgi:hypothetical protein